MMPLHGTDSGPRGNEGYEGGYVEHFAGEKDGEAPEGGFFAGMDGRRRGWRGPQLKVKSPGRQAGFRRGFFRRDREVRAGEARRKEKEKFWQNLMA